MMSNQPGYDEIAHLLSHTQLENNRLMLERQTLEAQVAQLRQQLEAIRIMPILFNTLPKSGSVYVARSLAEGLGLPLVTISHGTFPTDLIDLSQLKQFSEGNAVCQSHLDGSDVNVRMLARYCPRVVVHVRDPRGAMLSWVHHLLRLEREAQHDLLLTAEPQVPSGFSAWSMQEQLDWGIDAYLPLCVRWVEQWVEAEAQGRLKVCFTTYERFASDADGFVRSLLTFFGIDGSRFEQRAVEKTIANNFRSGEPDQWKRVLTKEQLQRAETLIPASLCERFEWARGVVG